jgi:hypothetical protein
MMDAELPTHLLYMLVFGGLVLAAAAALFVELGVRGGKRRRGLIFWSVVGGLIGALFFVINVANVLTETAGPGAG